jgi:hypothetical protein
VGGLPESLAELAAEVRPGEARGGREILDIQALEIAGISQILGPEQMAGGWSECHGGNYPLGLPKVPAALITQRCARITRTQRTRGRRQAAPSKSL